MKSPWRKHLIIPDVQVRPGVDTRYLTAISNYIAEKRPDVIVCLGDFADLPSLSSYSLALEREGQRYLADLKATHEAMSKLVAFKKTCKNYRPKMHLTLGNHEERIVRTLKDQPNLVGIISPDDLKYKEAGWQVHQFLYVLNLDGVEYSHYFIGGVMGRPVSSAAALLKRRQNSAVMGHVQAVDMAIHPSTQQTAIFAGICNTHDENYLTLQGNCTRRQIIMLHEVRDGRFDPMFISLDYLLRNYA